MVYIAYLSPVDPTCDRRDTRCELVTSDVFDRRVTIASTSGGDRPSMCTPAARNPARDTA
jgi:hypothetical protein